MWQKPGAKLVGVEDGGIQKKFRLGNLKTFREDGLTDGRPWLYSSPLRVLLEEVYLVVRRFPGNVGNRLTTDVVVLVSKLLIDGASNLIQSGVVDVVTTFETVYRAVVQLHSYMAIDKCI